MAQDQIGLQFSQIARVDGLVLELSKPRTHTVDHRPAPNDFVHELARVTDGGTGLTRDAQTQILASHQRRQVFQGQRGTVEGEGLQRAGRSGQGRGKPW
jgi:hypothetical protein